MHAASLPSTSRARLSTIAIIAISTAIAGCASQSQRAHRTPADSHDSLQAVAAITSSPSNHAEALDRSGGQQDSPFVFRRYPSLLVPSEQARSSLSEPQNSSVLSALTTEQRLAFVRARTVKEIDDVPIDPSTFLSRLQPESRDRFVAILKPAGFAKFVRAKTSREFFQLLTPDQRAELAVRFEPHFLGARVSSRTDQQGTPRAAAPAAGFGMSARPIITKSTLSSVS
ncbi:MAG TPA: hypothetical protein VHW73_08390, partial [Rudaea sp.]|nr:hypothetical protein [Rudaea sp.]